MIANQSNRFAAAAAQAFAAPRRRSMGTDWQIGAWGATDSTAQPNNSYNNDLARGFDPTSPTGTTGAIDPETGAYGTAGTPMTCGYGMSGSTIGTGYHADRAAWDNSRYPGSTPDAYSYNHGGRPYRAHR